MKLIWIFLPLIHSVAVAQIAQNDKTCFVGTADQSYYVTSFEKALAANNSPLVREFKYKKKRLTVFKNNQNPSANKFTVDNLATLPLGIHNLSQFIEGKKIFEEKNWVTQDEVRCALMNIPFIDTQKALCDSSQTKPSYTQLTPCINNEIVEYIHFVTNKAFRCFGSKMDDYTKETLIKKINLESAFGFFFADKKGKGISQFVSISAYEMSSVEEKGNRYLQKHLDKNPQDCAAFSEILKVNPNTSSIKMNTCGYVNLQDGIGRSLIQGFGLYFYYRDTSYHSARKLLAWLGLKPSSHKYYQEMLKITTLGMYNKGPKPVIDGIKFFFEENELKKYTKNSKKAYSIFMSKVKSANFYLYAEAADSQFKKVFTANGSCKLKVTNL